MMRTSRPLQSRGIMMDITNWTVWRWHTALAMRRHDRSWHRNDLREEMNELRHAIHALHQRHSISPSSSSSSLHLSSHHRSGSSRYDSNGWISNSVEQLRLRLNCWSEISDVMYTFTRSCWSGHFIANPFAK
jgi:hypothetical protein